MPDILSLRLGAACALLMVAAITSHGAEPARGAAILPSALDLTTALELADRHNPDLLRARERINEIDGALKTTRSNLLPDLTASGQYQEEDQDRVGSFGGDSEPDGTTWRAGLELVQPLYSGGRLRAATQARRFEKQAAEFDIVTARAGLFTDVYRNYFDALLARETITVQEESLAVLNRQLQIASNRFVAGAGPRFDVLQAEVRVANARPPLIRAVNDYRIAIDDLRTTIGAVYADGSGPGDIQLSGSWDHLPELGNLEAALSMAMTNRSELMAARNERDAAEQYLRRSRSERAPRIDLYAGYGVENDRYADSTETLEGWQVGVRAALSIWEGGRVSGDIIQAQSRLDQLTHEVEALRLNIELEVRNAWNNAEEAREILSATKLVIAQAEEALRLAENRYSAGALTQLDVLSSELEYTRARLEEITAARNYHLAVIEFQRAMGLVPGLDRITENEPPTPSPTAP